MVVLVEVGPEPSRRWPQHDGVHAVVDVDVVGSNPAPGRHVRLALAADEVALVAGDDVRQRCGPSQDLRSTAGLEVIGTLLPGLVR